MTAHTHHEDELGDRLHALVDPIDEAMPSEPVLRRGRTAVRRTRVLGMAAALSVLATAGALGSASGLLGSSERRLAGPAGSSTTSVAHTGGTPHSKNTGRPAIKGYRVPAETWCLHVGPQRAREEDRRFGSTRVGYADLVIEHLDPQQLHLHASERGGGETRTGRNCTLYALGADLGYTSPGDDGLGVVSVEVTTQSWEDQARLAQIGWHPAASIPSGALHAYVHQDSGGTAVAVVRADGTTVQVYAERLWGNNSQTSIAHMDLTVDQLLDTAADPRFQLP